MIFAHGKKWGKAKTYKHNQDVCIHCNAPDLEVTVYREYVHIMLLPFFPTGERKVQIVCNSCGSQMRKDTIRRHYEAVTKAPLYMYSSIFALLLLFVGIGLFIYSDSKKRTQYINAPKAGDVYAIAQTGADKKARYFFLKVMRISGDTVIVAHNHLQYLSQPGSLFSDDDYFMKDEEWQFLKTDLKTMLDKEEIYNVFRNYAGDHGFNRLK